MRKIYCLFSALLFFGVLFSQQLRPENHALIWRGFNHKWTYNHRINGIGDYVQYSHGKPTTSHISATGTGKDSTYYTSYYTAISTPDAVFEEAVFKNVQFEGAAEDLHDLKKTVSIPLHGPGAVDFLNNKAAYLTLINGFNMRSDRPADKLQVLKMAVEDGRPDSSGDHLLFDLHIGLVLNCKSLECSPKRMLSYTFDVYFLVVGMEKGVSAAGENYFLNTYDWGTCKELSDKRSIKCVSGSFGLDGSASTIGIKAFGITLNKAEHLLELNNSIDSIRFSEGNKSKLLTSSKFLFKQWKNGMQGTPASHFQSLFSFRQKGYAIMDLDLVMLQFKNGKIEYGNTRGVMTWCGHNQKLGYIDKKTGLYIQNTNSVNKRDITDVNW